MAQRPGTVGSYTGGRSAEIGTDEEIIIIIIIIIKWQAEAADWRNRTKSGIKMRARLRTTYMWLMGLVHF